MNKEFYNTIQKDLYNIIEKIKLHNGEINDTALNANKDLGDSNYSCSICSHSFKSNKNLNRHNLRAHSDKKFICSGYYIKDNINCEAKFAEKSGLTRHIKKKHTPPQE